MDHESYSTFNSSRFYALESFRIAPLGTEFDLQHNLYRFAPWVLSLVLSTKGNHCPTRGQDVGVRRFAREPHSENDSVDTLVRAACSCSGASRGARAGSSRVRGVRG